MLPTIGLRHTNAFDSQSLRTLFQQLQLMGMDIAGDDLALILHVNGQREGLAAGCSTYVQHLGILCRCGDHRHQTGGSVLHHEAALREGRQTLQIAGGADLEAAGQPRMLFHRSACLTQLLFQRIRGRLEMVGLDGGGHHLIIQPQEALRFLRTQQVDQPFHQPLGMAVADGQIVRRSTGQRRHIHPVSHKFPQHGVDHAGRLGAVGTAGHLHRLVHRSVMGDLIHKQDLVTADAQNVANDALQLFCLLGAVAADVVIQQHLVLHHAVAQTGGQRRLTTVQLIFGNGALETAVRPCIGTVDLHQHFQRHVTGARLSLLFHTPTCTL